MKDFQELFTEIKSLDHAILHDDKEFVLYRPKATGAQSIVKLPGDASTRKYYRVHRGKESFILMVMESFEKEDAALPFLATQSYLSKVGIDVPAVYDFNSKKGLIFLEDLGDTTLLHYLKTVTDPSLEKVFYQKIIDKLLDMQIKVTPSSGKKIPAFDLRFDYEKLMWEVNFTIEHFYERHLKRSFSDRDRKILQDGFSKICTSLASEPMVFTHRDFHSRNIMVVSGEGKSSERYVFIDFQDARMGAAQYDLVSLLRDSYYQLGDAQVFGLVEYYLQRKQELTKVKINSEQFNKTFDLMTIQRNFKAIGSFASFYNLRQNAAYLKYIGNTFENIRRALLRNSQFFDLREVLTHYYYF